MPCHFLLLVIIVLAFGFSLCFEVFFGLWYYGLFWLFEQIFSESLKSVDRTNVFYISEMVFRNFN